jgi:hypothetical protein
MDGRTQLYAPQFWRAMYVEPKRKLTESISSIRADAAILPTSHSRLHDSLIALGWHQTFHDDRAEVLVPPAAPIATIEENAK